MRRISINSVQPGMKLGRSIYNSNGQVLLNAGVVLNDKYIDKLIRLGIPALYVDDGWLSDIEVEDVISDEVRVEVTQKIKYFFNNEEGPTPASQSLIGVKEIGNTINDIIDQLLESNDVVYDLVDIRSLDEYTFGHSVNVCILALITGIHLGYSKAKLYHLGIGALLHDIGKTKVPTYILNKPGKLTNEEFEEIKKHSKYGYHILLEKSNISRLSALIALQHHERGNGEGYPKGIDNEEMLEMSKVTGMVDMYDALTSNRVYREAFAPHIAYEMLKASTDIFFEKHLVNSFLYHIAAYPAGTLVRLSNQEVAAVVANKPGLTTKPKVRLLFDKLGTPYKSLKEFWIDNENDINEVITDDVELRTLLSYCSENVYKA